MMKPISSEAQSLLNEEFFRVPAEFQKLQLLKELALGSARRAKDALPDKVKKLILNIAVNSKLQDDAHDQLEITITFNLTPPSAEFQFSLLPQKVFCVNCLDEQMEVVVERRFKQESFKLIANFHKFLCSYADEIKPST
jgi:hypothetical protein